MSKRLPLMTMRYTATITSVAVAVVSRPTGNHAFCLQTRNSRARPQLTDQLSTSRRTSHSVLQMSGFPQEEDLSNISASSNKHSRNPELSAVVVGTVETTDGQEYPSYASFFQDSFLPVMSTAFLITANTVGASCLALPDLAAGPGFGATCLASLGIYFVNFLSGLCMAEVAIKQYESSGADVPSSFKEFADTSFNSPMVATVLSGISILTNACVLAFTFAKAGEMGSSFLGGSFDPNMVSLAFVTLLGVMMSIFNAGNLSAVASVCVTGLFISFAGLLLPGLASVQHPIATLVAPGIADDMLGSLGQAAPVILLSLVYQNIVPSVTKILNYDRQKTVASLALGSFIPFAMYMAWTFASLGGGIDTGAGIAGPLLTGFMLSTIGGSSVATSMSVAEEFDSFLKPSSPDSEAMLAMQEEDAEKYVFSLPAIAAALALPLIGEMVGGDDMTIALGLAGSIGSPLLYGVVPAIMAWNQRQDKHRLQKNLVPGGIASLGALGLAATGFVGQELAQIMVYDILFVP